MVGAPWNCISVFSVSLNSDLVDSYLCGLSYCRDGGTLARSPAFIFEKRTRITVAAITFVALAAAAAIYVLTRTPLYESSAKVWVQAKVPGDGTNTSGSAFTPLAYFFNSPIATASEVLKSSLVFDEAVHLYIQAHPNMPPPTVDGIEGGFKVEPVKEADVIVVTLRDSVPQRAQGTLIAILEAFRRLNSTQASGSAVQSRVFLERQLAIAQQTYSETRQRLRQFQDENKAVDLQQQTDTQLEQIASFEKESADAEIEAAEDRARIQSLNSELASIETPGTAAGTTSNSPGLRDALQKDIVNDEMKLLSLRSRLLDTHPRVIRLSQQIARKKQMYSSLGGSSVNTTKSVDAYQETLLEDLSKAKADLTAAGNRSSVLSERLRNMRAQLLFLPEKQRKLAELTRAEKVAAAALDDIESRLSKSKYAETVAAETSNIQVIEQPTLPLHATAGNSARNIVIAGIGITGVSVGLYVLLALLNPFALTAYEVAQIFRLPIAGCLGSDLERSIDRVRVFIANWARQQIKVIVIAGATDADDSADVAVALAKSISRAGFNVLLVDADSSSPQCHTLLSQPAEPGLGEAILDNDGMIPQGCLRRVSDHFYFVPHGSRPGVGISAERIQKSFGSSAAFDYLLIHAPSAEFSAECFAMLNEQCGLLAVAKLGQSPRRALKAFAMLIAQNKPKVAAFVVSNSDEVAIADMAIAVPQTHESEPAISW